MKLTLQYGSFFYFFYPAFSVGLLTAMLLLLRNRSLRTKKMTAQAVAVLNFVQHMLKAVIYPHLWGTGFSYLNTAYNVCALLIIAMPFVNLCKSQSVKDFIYIVGFFAGFLTMFLPTWFIGQPVFGWELSRFYICHSLLMLSSALPLALGLHRLSWKSWYKMAPLFIGMLAAVFLDNILCVYMGLVPGASPEELHGFLSTRNPLWIMGPQGGGEWVAQALAPVTPDILAHGGHYVPILWYCWPLYIPFTLLAFGLLTVADRKRFWEDAQVYLKAVVTRSRACFHRSCQVPPEHK